MKNKSRSYVSPLREEHVGHTREKILEALVRVLAQGPAELSVPAVAEEAGVSIPTVYRHFGSKRSLTHALYDHYQERIGTLWEEDDITDVESFIELLPAVFRKHDEVDDTLRAAMSTDFANRLRRQMMPQRQASMDRALERSGVKNVDRERMRDVFTILTSSATQRAFREWLGLGPDEAADRVIWTMRHLLSSVEANGTTKGTRGKGKR